MWAFLSLSSSSAAIIMLGQSNGVGLSLGHWSVVGASMMECAFEAAYLGFMGVVWLMWLEIDVENLKMVSNEESAEDVPCPGSKIGRCV